MPFGNFEAVAHCKPNGGRNHGGCSSCRRQQKAQLCILRLATPAKVANCCSMSGAAVPKPGERTTFWLLFGLIRTECEAMRSHSFVDLPVQQLLQAFHGARRAKDCGGGRLVHRVFTHALIICSIWLVLHKQPKCSEGSSQLFLARLAARLQKRHYRGTS